VSEIKAPDQSARDTDAADCTPAPDRAELFQAVAVRTFRNHFALRFPRSLPRKSAPVISATKRATSTIWAYSPLGHSIQALIRRLVVLKLWQARDTFDPAA